MDERKIGGVSRGELERRWKLVRDYLRERRIDALVSCTTDTEQNAGCTRWLTDSLGPYRDVVVFHAEDLMTVVEHGFHGARREAKGDDPNRPGVGEILSVAEFPAVGYSQRYEGVVVAELLKKRGYRRVALANPDAMPRGFAAAVEAALADGELIDATDAFDRWQAIKSAEEQALIMKAIEMQDQVFGELLRRVRPGMRDLEVASIIHYEGRLRGSTHGTIMVGSAEEGKPAMHQGSFTQGRTIRPGDYLSVLLENTGPGGYFAEMARPISLGKAAPALVEALEQAKAAQAYSTSLMKPGADCREIFAAYNDYAKRNGMPQVGRIHSHGQGYDIVQRPLIRFDETMKLEPGMFFAVHPSQSKPDVFTFVCDNLFITEGGNSGWLHASARKVYEI